eukprot:691955-Karenia_brevis.AAC.1
MLAEAEAEVERRKVKRSPIDVPADAAESVAAEDDQGEAAAAASEGPPAGDEGIQLVPPGL